MPQSYVAMYAHLVFSTKGRLPQITGEMQERLYSFMGGVFRERKCVLMAAGGVSDHVHLLASIHKEMALSPLLRDVKALSSGWVHDTFREAAGFAWQTGYAGFSVSQSNLETVRGYIANQEEHHRRMTFKEELIELLKRHGIEYDERYVFE
jgi:putative transposase